MAIIFGSSITIDESAGLQNSIVTPALSPGDINDNDIAYTALPKVFTTRLDVLIAASPGQRVPINAALSGYDSANLNGSNFVQWTSLGANAGTAIAFSGADGSALNGTDSGLKTTDGTPILLYTDTVDDNIVLGKTAAGNIVFAGYLEETVVAPATAPTGAKMWLVQYSAIHNDSAVDPDDSMSILNNALNVRVDQGQQFSLEGAPSGQNLFMMFGDKEVAIVVTGTRPANQSDGESIITGDTVNSSQGGGGTTLGTNNQMIDPKEGMYFTFVKGANTDFTVPNLDQNEADVEANIQFSSLINSLGASFTIAQTEPRSKSATVIISACNAVNESGVNYVHDDGLHKQSTVDIKGVNVSITVGTRTYSVKDKLLPSGDKNPYYDPNVKIAYSDTDHGIATVQGLRAAYTVEYQTVGFHNRVLIQNTATNGATNFDIGGFGLTQASTEVIGVGSRVSFEDDGPTLNAVAATQGLQVDESDLATNATADFSSLFTPSYGADGAGSVGQYTLGVTAGTDSSLDDTASGLSIYLYQDGTDVVGRVGKVGDIPDPGGAIAFRVSVNGAGVVTLDQVLAIKHPTNDPDEVLGLTGSNLITLTATATDRDGDTKAATADITGAISFRDDGPTLKAVATTTFTATQGLQVDESDLTTNATADFSSLFTPGYGADGAGSVGQYTLGVTAGTDSSLDDTASGLSIYLYQDGTSVVGRVGKAGDIPDPGGAIAFRVSVNGAGVVTLDQVLAIKHPTNDPDEALGLTGSHLITLTATATDKDGDTKAATADITGAISFKDDGPTLNAVAATKGLLVDESDLTTNAAADFSSLFIPSYGADGAGSVGQYTLGVTAGTDSSLDDTASGLSIYLYQDGTDVVGRVGKVGDIPDSGGAIAFRLSVNGAGVVTLDQVLAIKHPTNDPDEALGLTGSHLITLTATATDRDGDTKAATADITGAISFKDDGPTLNAVAATKGLLVDESDLTTNATADFSSLFTPGYGADGAGSVGQYTLGVTAGTDSSLDDTATGLSIYLYQDGTDVVGRVGAVGNVPDSGGAIAFRLSVNGAGVVALDQVLAIKHPTNDPDEALGLTGSHLITLTATATDKDGDTKAATADITGAISFKDDGPTLNAVAATKGLLVDESDLTTNATADFSSLFTPGYGADGAGSVGQYTLGVTAGTDSSLDDTATGLSIYLYQDGTDVVGRVGAVGNVPDSGGAIAFRLSVNGAGVVALDQVLAIKHPTNDPDEALGLTGSHLITLTATATDKDGDTKAATADITGAISFKDDGPTLNAVAATKGLLVDESDLTTNATADFSSLFTPGYGADGAGSVGQYTLGVTAGTDSSLDDTATGLSIYLYQDGTDVVGRVGKVGDIPDSGGAIAFRVSVNGAGVVTLDQVLAIKHPTNDPDEALGLTGSHLITLTATATDKDGDTKAATADITGAISFKDDGPTLNAVAATKGLLVDESDLTTNATADFSSLFTPGYGADGAGSVGQYTLGVTAGTDSSLDDTATGLSIYLYQDGTDVVGRVGAVGNVPDSGGAIAFRLSVNGAGVVALDQVLAIKHPTNDPDEALGLTGSHLITLTATATDKDGDTKAATADITGAISFKDDGPTLNAVAATKGLLVDESDLTTNATADFSSLFTPGYGADGAGSVGQYTLGVTAGTDSSLDDTATGLSIYLYQDGTDVVGRVGKVGDIPDSGGAIAFRVSVNGAGVVTLDQVLAIKHPTNDPDEALGLTGSHLITLTATATDKDGDTKAATADITGAISFKDDGPTLNAVAATQGLQVDESDLTTNATADFSSLFTPGYGADGAGSVGQYTLGVTAGTDSSLDDTATGLSIYLYQDGTDVVGRVGKVGDIPDSGGAIAFRVSVNGAGVVTLDQVLAIKHPTNDPDEALGLTGSHLITLTATATDRDGDTKAATADITGAISFKDDGPTLNAVAATQGLLVDESDLTTNATADFSSLFTPGYGADGAGSVGQYTLGVTAGTDSSLDDTATGLSIYLYQDGTSVVGRVGKVGDIPDSGGAIAFRLSVNGAGVVTLDQVLAIKHPTNDPDEALGLTGSHLITLTATATDRDGDTKAATADITGAISFRDDGPKVTATSNLVYSNASNPTPGGTGVFDYVIGADSRLAFSSSSSDFASITLSGTVGSSAIQAQQVSWISETDRSAVFNVAFDYQANPNSTVLTHAAGTLAFDKVGGTYTFALNEPISGYSTLTTSHALSITGYESNTKTEDKTQPLVSVARLSENFFVQFTGVSEPGGGTGGNNLQAIPLNSPLTNPPDITFQNGDLFTQAADWVSISGTANGVAGDTLQKGEVLDMDFWGANPYGYTNPGNPAIFPPSGIEQVRATGMFLKFDGIGSEDLVVVLKLVNANDSSKTTTQAIIIDNSDILKFGSNIPTGYGISLDSNDGAVIIENNDFNALNPNYLIYGAQLLVSTEGISGTGINLNPLTGSSGGSTVTKAFDATMTDNDVIKVSDIGFVAEKSANLDAVLSFDVAVKDADGDGTIPLALQNFKVGIVNGTTFTGSDDPDAIQGSIGNDSITGGAGVDEVTGRLGADRFVFATADIDTTAGAVTDIINDFSGSGGQGDAIQGSYGAATVTNYLEAGTAAADLATLLAAADTALDGIVKYYVGQVGSDAYLVTDQDGMGHTEVIQLVGVTLTNIQQGDIVAA